MSHARIYACSLALVCSLAQSAAAKPLAEPRWLKVDLRAPDLSVVPAEVHGLSEPRREQLNSAAFGYVELLRSHELRFEADGRLHVYDIYVRHFLTPEAVRDYGNLDIALRSAFDALTIEEAWVARADGSRRSIDRRVIQVVDEPSDVFSDRKRVVVPFEGLAPGATAVLVAHTVSDLRRFPLPFMRIFQAPQLVPVERFEVLVRWPKGREAPNHKTNDRDLRCVSQVDKLHCTRDLVPAVKLDPHVRSWADVVPHLAVSVAKSWLELARTERRLVDERAVADESIVALANKLAEQAAGPSELLQHIHRYVADQIRYVAIEHGSASVVPNRASVTHQRGFGDCKDKVTLFVALAQQLGVPAFPALVASARYDDAGLLIPGWAYFDHMIACADEGPGRAPTCIDLTMPELPAGMLPPALDGAVALMLDGISDRPTRLPTPDFSLEIEIRNYNRLECDGSVTERVERHLGGPSAWMVRSALRSQDAVTRERMLRERYEEVMGKLATPTVEVEEGTGASVLVLKSSARYPGNGAPAEELTDMRDADPWLVDYAAQLRGQNQHHLYHLQGLRARSEVHYELCPSLVPSHMGAALALDSEFGRVSRRYARTQGAVKVETTVAVPSLDLDPPTLARFDAYLNSVLANLQIWFGVRRASGKP